jgi:hypothetical protein
VFDVVHLVGAIDEYITKSFFLIVTEVMCREVVLSTKNEGDYQNLKATVIQF